MPIFNVCGTNYQYPNVGDKPWGTIHIAWASAVSSCLTSLNTQVSGISANQFLNPMLADGDLITQIGSVPARLPVGADGQVLTVVTGLPAWSTVAGAGDVVGPASSVNENLAVFDGVTGKLLKETTVNVSATGNIAGVNDLSVGGTLNANGALNVGLNATITGQVTAGSTNASTANTFWQTVTRSTGTTVGVRGVAISAESGSVTSLSNAEESLGVTATIDTVGRPIWVGLSCDSSGGTVEVNDLSATAGGIVKIKRNGTTIFLARIDQNVASGLSAVGVPCSSFWTVCTQAAGTYAFTATIQADSGVTSMSANDIKIVAFEL